MFTCENGGCVSLTFYCDGLDDCGDNSDEKNCAVKSCGRNEWQCDIGQCLSHGKRCDLYHDCLDNSDEHSCGSVCNAYRCIDRTCIPLLWINDGMVDCDGFLTEDEPEFTFWYNRDENNCIYQPDIFGKVKFGHQRKEIDCSMYQCPSEFYKCPSSYCIPVQNVCNGYKDCPAGEDEVSCETFQCPGYYRCERERYCIHWRQFCDGTRHCPTGDDERFCDQNCPKFCNCHGRVVTCSKNFTRVQSIPSDVRKLDLSGIDIKGDNLNLMKLHYLAILILNGCHLSVVADVFQTFPNMIKLELQGNSFRHLSNKSFQSFPKLTKLDLSHNTKLYSVANNTFQNVPFLEELNLHNTMLGEVSSMFTYFRSLVHLKSLNLSKCCITAIEDNVFGDLRSLKVLDLRHNDIEQFSKDIFNGLDSLQDLYTDSYKLCCDVIRPKSLHSHRCRSTENVISSCTDLLGEDMLRIMLWIIATFAVLGNIVALSYRIKYDRQSLKRSYGIFVTNLSVADCLMGMYMLAIGCVDLKYKGSYLWNDYIWRHSALCKFAGFISTVSSESSCIFITLITLDRFLAIKFPFRQVKFNTVSTTASVISTWILALALAGIPLLPQLDHWNLYSQNSVCLALPLTSGKRPGWQYSSGLFVGLNFALFLLIGAGQVSIYRAVKSSSKIRPGGSPDAVVARKLFLVVFTDFLCWFPVGVMGILTLQGFHIDDKVYAWTAVTVLPINSALNPILYTLSSILRQSTKNKKGLYLMSSQDTDVKFAMPARIYVGAPTNDMVSLAEFLLDPDASLDLKCDVITRIQGFILDKSRTNRRYAAVKQNNVFIERDQASVTSICLSLEPDKDREDVAEDIIFLSQCLVLQNLQ